MCGRYHFDETTIKELEDLIKDVEEQAKLRQICGDIHPDEEAPVLLANQDGLQLSWQRWGFPHFQKSGVIYNARSETITDKKMFSDSIQHRRVVIPCAWFYEWNSSKEKIAFRRNDASALYLAGCYRSFHGQNRFVILTAAANASVASVHERMPLILEKDALIEWLADGPIDGVMLRPHPVSLQSDQTQSQLHLFE